MTTNSLVAVTIVLIGIETVIVVAVLIWQPPKTEVCAYISLTLRVHFSPYDILAAKLSLEYTLEYEIILSTYQEKVID